MTTTDTPAPTALERREFTRDEFGAEARRRFGDNPLDWAFVCPWCGDVATAREFPEGYRPYVGQICIGRLPVQFPYAPIVADPARGCHTWTTNFQIDGPWIVKLPDGTAARCFALAPTPSQPPQGVQGDAAATPGPGGGTDAPDAAVRPGNDASPPAPSEPFLTGDDHAESES